MDEVVDVDGPAFACRTYLEQREVRHYLRWIDDAHQRLALADIGCGFGRLTPVLAEFGEVVGFEREPEFVDCARALWPALRFEQVASLAELPAEDASFDFGLSFTVLQHLIDPVAAEVVAELLRVLRRPGHLLLCEETDPGHVSGDITDPAARVTVGRPVERYEELLWPLRFVSARARLIEPTYRRQDGSPAPSVGTYMLFRR